MNSEVETPDGPITVYARWGLVPWSFATETTVLVNNQVTEQQATG